MSARLPPRRLLLLAAAGLAASCAREAAPPAADAGADAQVTSRGAVEVTARLVEVPEGAIFRRELYDYATVLKYEVVAVHRGDLAVGATIYVGHYNPWKPRAEAADRHVKDIGGTVRQFRAGRLHRMALEPSMDDVFMGGVVDKYFGRHEGAVFWAVWTNDAE